MKNRLKVQRAIHDLTQEALAKKIGVTRQTVNAMELRKYVPSTVLALRLSKVFGVPVEEFFMLEDNEYPEGLSNDTVEIK